MRFFLFQQRLKRFLKKSDVSVYVTKQGYSCFVARVFSAEIKSDDTWFLECFWYFGMRPIYTLHSKDKETGNLNMISYGRTLKNCCSTLFDKR